MTIIYGYLDTDKVSSIHDLILDVNTSTNLAGDLSKIKWDSPTPQAIADLVYAQMTNAEAMAYYKDPTNGWTPEYVAPV